MSALTKPFIHTTNTIGGVVAPINVENIISIDKITVAESSVQNSAAVNDIIFMVAGHGSNPKEIRWRYATEEERDNDFDGVVSAVSTEVVPAS